MRERELRCACAALGIEAPILLDHQDGYLTETDPETIVAEILAVAADVHPQVMLTFGLDGISGHPDHVAIGRFASEAYHRATDLHALYTLAVPQSLTEKLGMTQIRAVPDETITITVDISAVWEAKMSSIRCHATQITSSPITQDRQQRQRLFLGKEYFVLSGRRSGRDFLAELEPN